MGATEKLDPRAVCAPLLSRSDGRGSWGGRGAKPAGNEGPALGIMKVPLGNPCVLGSGVVPKGTPGACIGCVLLGMDSVPGGKMGTCIGCGLLGAWSVLPSELPEACMGRRLLPFMLLGSDTGRGPSGTNGRHV